MSHRNSRNQFRSPLVSALQLSETQEWNIRARNEIYPTSFNGYSLEELRSEGGQGKGPWTGLYTTPDLATHYVKRSAKYLGDNIAEVTGSRFLGSVIENQAVPYHFVRNLDENDAENYVASRFREGFESLASRLKRSPGGKGRGWLSSNPSTASNKRRIYNLFSPEQRADMARVLAGCAWLGEYDCQVENICFYTERNSDGTTRERVGKFDNGWMLAGICKEKHRIVRLFATKSFVGNRATHEHAGLPTNHFNDYPDIINSVHFLSAMDEIVQKGDHELIHNRGQFVTKALQEIDENYNNSSEEKIRAFRAFAQHIGAEIPNALTLPNAIKKFLEEKLIQSLKDRTDSMALNRAFLNVKLKLANNTLQPADLEAIRNVILQRFKGKTVGSFMPTDFNPPVTTLLSQALMTLRTKTTRGLISFMRELYNPNQVIHETKSTVLGMLHSFTPGLIRHWEKSRTPTAEVTPRPRSLTY